MEEYYLTQIEWQNGVIPFFLFAKNVHTSIWLDYRMQAVYVHMENLL